MNKIKPQFWIFATAFIAFLLLANQDQGVDSYSYALSIRDGVGLFHPHHLLYNFMGWLLFQLFGFLSPGCFEFLSSLNSLLGALTLAVIFSILRKKLSFMAAIMGALMFSGLYSFWYYSTSVEVNMAAILFLCLALYWLFNRPVNAFNTIMIFVFVSLSMLFHQIAVLAVIPLLVYVMIRDRSFHRPILYSLPGLLLTAAIYLIIGFSQASQKNLSGVYYWITLYSHSGTWGKIHASNFAFSLWGIAKLFFGGQLFRAIIYGDNISTEQLAYLVIVIIILIGIAIMIFKSLISFRKNRTLENWLLISLIAIFKIFAFWWAPSDDGFWLYVFIFVLIFLNLNIKFQGITKYALSTTVILLLSTNLIFEFLPASAIRNSMAIQSAAILHRHGLSENDLVLTDFSQIRMAIDYDFQLKANTTSIVYNGPGDKDVVINVFQSRINESLKKGKVFVFENELIPEPHRRYMYERFTPADYLKTYKPYYPFLIPIDSLLLYSKMVKIYQIDKSALGAVMDSSKGISIQ